MDAGQQGMNEQQYTGGELNGDAEAKELRKLFVGGLSQSTTDESLKKYFEQYGEVTEVTVKKDPQTNRPRGFGFLTFARANMVDRAQEARPHKVDGKTVDTKRPVPREDGQPDPKIPVKKIFVGSLPDDVEESDLKEYFQNYGQIVSCSVVKNKDNNNPKKRSFAFVEFRDHDIVDKLCLIKNHTVKGRSVMVKRAMKKPQPGDPQASGGWGGASSGGWGPQAGYRDYWNGGGSSSSSSWGGYQGGADAWNQGYAAGAAPQIQGSNQNYWGQEESQGYGAKPWAQNGYQSQYSGAGYGQGGGGGPVRGRGRGAGGMRGGRGNARAAPYAGGRGGYNRKST